MFLMGLRVVTGVCWICLDGGVGGRAGRVWPLILLPVSFKIPEPTSSFYHFKHYWYTVGKNNNCKARCQMMTVRLLFINFQCLCIFFLELNKKHSFPEKNLITAYIYCGCTAFHYNKFHVGKILIYLAKC